MATSEGSSDLNLPLCKYGRQCYRKNPQHIREFRHPPKVDEENPIKSNDGGDWNEMINQGSC